jgi:hypothetical protein
MDFKDKECVDVSSDYLTQERPKGLYNTVSNSSPLKAREFSSNCSIIRF